MTPWPNFRVSRRAPRRKKLGHLGGQLHQRIADPVIARAERRKACDAPTRPREIQVHRRREAAVRLVDGEQDEIVVPRGPGRTERLVETRHHRRDVRGDDGIVAAQEGGEIPCQVLAGQRVHERLPEASVYTGMT